MTPLNEELIERVLARIEADPTAWDQGDFFKAKKLTRDFCKTTACFAGHALLESGWTLDLKESTIWPARLNVVARDPEGEVNVNYPEEAATLLGLTDDEAETLFFETQTESFAELCAVIDRIRADRKVNEDVTPG